MLATSTAATPPSPQSYFSLFTTRIEFRSMFIATLIIFLFLCLAYLTNPSETSFRSYLTERSFRHHLSRLDDPSDPDHTNTEGSKTDDYCSSSPRSPSSFGSLESGSSAFHFSNRAAIALRTPRHAFHSFGFFTIAAVIPNPKTNPPSREMSSVVSTRNATGTSDHDPFPLKEVWFVGAFGRWWRGGVVDPAWPSQPDLHPKGDEEGWSSGILNIKALDRREDFSGLPFPTTTHDPRTPQRSAPPKLRSRDRSTSHPHRSSSPPPLPKSAVLPLHTPKHSQSLTAPQPPASHQRPFPQHYPPSPPSTSGAAPNRPSPNFDSIPAVAELIQQISQTRALNLGLRNQLSEHTSAATAVDAALGAELTSVREAKRIDDVARSELKARIKALEDNRRAAEAGKRDAERRLRATQKAKAEAGTRIEKLGEEIRALEVQAILLAGEATAQEESDISAQVKQRKREVSVAEEVVMALNDRVRELEESIESERVALAAAREKAAALQHEQDHHKYGFMPMQGPDTWERIPAVEFSLSIPDKMEHDILDPFPTPLEKDSDRDRERGGLGPGSTGSSPPLCTLTTVPPLNIGYDPSSRSQLHPIGNERCTLPLISDGLNKSLDSMSSPTSIGEIGSEDVLPRRFPSDSEPFDDRDWRNHPSVSGSVPAIGSESHHHVFPSVSDDPTEGFESFGIHRPPRHRITSDSINVSPVWSSRANSDPLSPRPAAVPPQEARGWWGHGPDKERRATIDGTEPRRGLNPDAKVFSFSPEPPFGAPVAPASASASGFLLSGAAKSTGTGSMGDILKSNATATSTGTPGFLSGLARAFVPSPAEREALHRALGGSTNTSLERLPSLSEVGSGPTSPELTHVPAHPVASGNPLGRPWFDIGAGAGTGRSWLRELRCFHASTR
ncbi:hypothetical protein F5148DRAFT_1016941 [Russula earlei]|uniref:Uncharacterized protein n=1 Tax=Russula earlei TaxID=71964 RepID=A0ACC0U3F3_9AGAM|nr:hypothetical protein F5148DRAFT_1016941 [Russula earlei]